MIIIKITAPSGIFSELLLRQLPIESEDFKNYRFHVNDEIIKCDWWIILHGSAIDEEMSVECDPNHIVYISMEPDEKVLGLNDRFLKQFSLIYSCDQEIEHKNIINFNVSTWWVGIDVGIKNKKHNFYATKSLSFEYFKNLKPPPKINKISCIVSSKKTLPGHKQRAHFLDLLMKEPVGKYIDLFGEGYKPISDKLDAILPYRFHLSIENSFKSNYWSEKIGDAFLGFSLPIYCGCINIDSYFPKNSFFSISLDPKLASKKMMELILTDTCYSSEILKARNKILHEYNIFYILKNLCSENAKIIKKCIIYPNYTYSKNLFKKLFYLFKGH